MSAPASPGGAGTVTLAMLAAMRFPGIGRAKARRLAAGIPVTGNADAALRVLANGVGKGHDVEAAWREASETVKAAESAGLHVVGMLDGRYPDRFANVPDPPCVLFVRGDPLAMGRRHALAIVGTRDPTPYGGKVARRSGASVSRAGFTVVSGLADGIDQAAHEGCLDAGGIGVAVMAHGLDTVYPRSASALARDLVAAGGCLVSEYPPGTECKSHRLVERDRLQSALSDGLFVVEAGLSSGTMHTVRAAMAQGRPVACLEHGEDYAGHPQVQANRKLLRAGEAVPVRDGQALAAYVAGLGPYGVGGSGPSTLPLSGA